jgi:gas vesicle protein
MGKSKFFTGMLIGALAGGLVTLFDKSTRKEVVQAAKDSGECVAKYAKHPAFLIETTKDIYEKVQTTATQVSEDIQFINQKVEEIKEMTPQVKEIIEETKDTFQSSTETYKETLHAEVEGKECGDVFKGY